MASSVFDSDGGEGQEGREEQFTLPEGGTKEQETVSLPMVLKFSSFKLPSLMCLSVFPRIEKLEKENNLLVKCKKNGWRDLSRELEECTKVLEEEAKSESRCCLWLP